MQPFGLIEGAAAASALAWAAAALLVARGARALPRLGAPPPPPRPDAACWPRVSAVVACRDEAEHVEGAVRSLLELDYPDLEVIAVDDRSTDGTAEILDGLARAPSPAAGRRLRVVHVRDLPEGWLGKCHALHEGARASSGAWLLFVDADVTLHPLALRLAAARALAERLDLLALVPHNEGRGPAMRAFLTYWLILLILALGLWAHRRGRQSLLGTGIGAFTLVRRDAYERAGGHAALRMTVIDDVSLGALVHAAGGRTEVAVAYDWVRVPYCPRLRDIPRVSRKNAFAVFEFRWSALVAATAAALAGDVLVPLGPLLRPSLLPFAAVTWASWAVIYGILARKGGGGTWSFLLHPLLSLTAVAAAWISAIAVAREGGVRWRGTVYPRRALRGILRRPAGGGDGVLHRQAGPAHGQSGPRPLALRAVQGRAEDRAGRRSRT